MPKSNSQQKSTPDARTRHQQEGGGTERSRRHSLGWGPARRPWEQSEGALLNCGRAREKINRPEHTAGGSQNKGSEKLQRRAGPSPLEVGGSGEGKGANSAPEKPPPPTRQTGPGSCLKTSWDSGWSTSTAGRVAARGQLLWTNASRRHPTSSAHCRSVPTACVCSEELASSCDPPGSGCRPSKISVILQTGTGGRFAMWEGVASLGLNLPLSPPPCLLPPVGMGQLFSGVSQSLCFANGWQCVQGG